MQYCAYCGNSVEAVSYVPCLRCGNPTNGAPRPMVGAKSTNPALIIIVVIVGGLMIVAILGIIAAIAIPSFLSATQRAKQKRTMAEIRSLATAVESYAADNNEYPKGTSLSELGQVLVPKYARNVPAFDGWGNGLRYACLKDAASPENEKCTGYVIGSAGKDGRFEQEAMDTLAAKEPQPTSSFDCDILYANGKFVEYPEGAQH